MSLSLLKPLVSPLVAWTTWLNQENERATRVALARNYAEGVHRSALTDEMRNMLRINSASIGAEFNINHMSNIIETVVDRLEVTALEADSPAATEWIGDQLYRNRFDGLQQAAHEAALRDGDAYIMVGADEQGRPHLTLEDAFDGVSGIVVVYGADRTRILVAFKLWQETEATPNSKGRTIWRVNAYWPDRVDKYSAGMGVKALTLTPIETVPWTLPGNAALGVPVFHFRNRQSKRHNGGRSEIADAIPLQDSLNRTLTSMIMSAELTAFSIRYAIGMKPPAALTPGMWINAYVKDNDTGKPKPPDEQTISWFNSIRFGNLEPGAIQPFIDEAKFLIDQMYVVTRTPQIGQSDSVSGESLKQREVSLIGKVKRAQVGFGNTWENVVTMMAQVARAYGTQEAAPPAFERVDARWRSPELRNATEVVENAIKIRDQIDRRTFLGLLADVMRWDDSRVDAILEAVEAEQTRAMSLLAAGIPTFATAPEVTA